MSVHQTLNSAKGHPHTGTRRHAKHAQVMIAITHATLSIKPPSYQQILDMDESVRKLEVPGLPAETPAVVPLPTICVCTFISQQGQSCKCQLLLVLIYLHRAFYARALIQHHDDLSKSAYYYSVQAILRAARDTLSWAHGAVIRSPAVSAHFHWIWSIAVAATVSCQVNSYVPHLYITLRWSTQLCWTMHLTASMQTKRVQD